MLFKNTMRPAYATAGGESSARPARSKIKDFLTCSEQSAFDDEYGSFNRQPGAQEKKQAPKKQPAPRRPKRKSGFDFGAFIKDNAKGLLFIFGALVVLALLVALVVAIFSAPQKDIKLKDNVFFTYIDGESKYRVVSNGETVKQAFEGEITLQPAKDNSFAYVKEAVAGEEGTTYNVYILKGSKLEAVVGDAADVIACADYEPGIIYKAGSRFHYYSAENQTPITNNASAKNFIISGDASVVVYTVDSNKEEDKQELRYFCKGASPVIGYNFVPMAISNDGKYVYGVFNSLLCCITVEDDGKKQTPTAITDKNYGEILGVNGINVEGDEIIFSAATAARTMSYMFSIKDGTKPIAEGVFTPSYSGVNVICPESFIDTFFTCKKTVHDAETDKSETLVSTYFLDKSGARKLADAEGKISPDGKFFYYLNEESTLTRVLLSSKNFEADTTEIMNEITDFVIIENGNINAMMEDVNKGWIYYLDASTLDKKTVSHSADLDSMRVCANSIYYSETDSDDVTTIYVSTEGSSNEVAKFKSSAPSETPIFAMGATKKGYAYFTDENGSVKLFYTSNGKKFSPVSESCTIPGYDAVPDSGEEENSPETVG